MEENVAQKALIDLAIDSAKENKEHARKWFIGFIISNAIWAIVVLVIVLSLLWFESQFEYESTQTTISQDTGEGSGNNIYQSGEHATYNEGGDFDGKAGNNYQDHEEDEENNEY